MSSTSKAQQQACDTCYRRKVRCDSRDQAQCTRCQAGGVQCTFLEVQKRLNKINVRNRGSSNAQGLRSLHAKVHPPITKVNKDASSQTLYTQTPSQRTSRDNQSPKHNLELGEKDVEEEGLARTALSEFLHRGFKSPTWSVFHERDPIRIAYVGTPISNLAYLVGQESPYGGDASLHFAFPSIRQALPWKPNTDMPLVKWYANMAADVSFLPEKEVCDQLIEDFFTKVHPGFPIVDEAEFRLQYKSDQTPVPLLLLQSVLLVGAHVSTHPKVSNSRSLVKIALFRRAKALFDLHYENNREHLIQAALLFTWHFEGADDIASNAYYWVGVACRLAFGLGLHRNLSSSARNVIPVQDRRIQRRLWWVLYQYDVLASLHHGRPLMVNEDECDQPPLVVEDFIEIDGKLNKCIHFEYCEQSVKLCSIITSILKLFSPGSLRRHHLDQNWIVSSRSALDLELQNWFQRLPSNLANASRLPQSFWCTQLHMHYNLGLLQLYRISHLPTGPGGVPRSLSPTQKSTEICHNAASSISNLFNSLLITDKINRCCFTSLTMLLAAAIHICLEARLATSNGSQLLVLQANSRVEDLFPAMSELSKYWPSAEAIHRLFRDVLANMKAEMETSSDAPELLSIQVQNRTVHGDADGANEHSHIQDNQIGLSDEDWNGLLGTWDSSLYFNYDMNGMTI